MNIQQTQYDVAVIGGGPAGMMAALRAAHLGARVVLLEKNSFLGKKLLITGGGRCNLCNAEYDVRVLSKKYGNKGEALLSSFSRFGVKDTMHFFENHGLPLKIEEGKRVFPISDKAQDVIKVLTNALREGAVEVLCGISVKGFASSNDGITGIETSHGRITARKYILATGGKSRPETGSTGEGFAWAKKLGHSIEEPHTALVPIKIKENWVKDLSGLSMSCVKISVFQKGLKKESDSGKILFTHFGVSGPLVLNMSKTISDLYNDGPVDLVLDMYPTEDIFTLNKRLREHLQLSLNKLLRNSMGGIIPPKMVNILLSMAKIDPQKQVNALTKEERLTLVKLLKALPLSVSGFLGVEKAIVTSGGISLKEIDFKTMQSKLFSSLYLVGDLLNFDRPSGGYSLQICWTTGYLAGENSAKK